jgi:hypothetical protein
VFSKNAYRSEVTGFIATGAKAEVFDKLNSSKVQEEIEC